MLNRTNLLSETIDGEIQVTKDYRGNYNVYANDVLRHSNCTADDVIRALTNYLTSYIHKAQQHE
jgi:hypothetical protein